MQTLYYLLWTVVAVALVYALVQLGLLLATLRKKSEEVFKEFVPLLKKLNESVEQVNTDLERVNALVVQIEELSEKVNHGIDAVKEIVSSPLIKLASLSSGAKKAIQVFLRGK